MSPIQEHSSGSEKPWRNDSDAQTTEAPLPDTPSEASSAEVDLGFAAVVSRTSHLSLARRVTSVGMTGTTDPDYEVDWDEKDPENPRDWPLWYKGVVVGFLSWNTWVM